MDLAELHLHWRENKYKGKAYRSYSLARAYRKNGKNRKEIILKLGKLTNEEAKRWRSFLKAIKKQDSFLATLDDVVVTKHFSYLDVAVANAIWDEWNLDDVFTDDRKKKVGCACIARILTVNRCVDPAVKSQTPDWFNKTALPWALEINPELINASRIFRELNGIEEHKEAICRYLFKQLSERRPDGLKSVFYDLSSTTFYGSRCVLMKWGHCKEGYQNHVVLALVVTSEGLPFYWEVLPGGTADATTITWLMERLKKRFKVNGITLVFDRGMVSDDNLTLLEDEDIKYISAMDKSQLEGITRLDFTKFSNLDPDRVEEQAGDLPNFIKLGDSTYYCEVNVEGNRRYILCFNPQLFKDQRKARRQAVEQFLVFVKEVNKELREAKKSRERKPTYKKFKRRIKKSKLIDFVDVELKVIHVERKAADGSKRVIKTFEGTAVVDDAQMLFAGRLDGFWLLVTNHRNKKGEVFELPPSEAIMPYRDKVIIESSFRDIKSFIEIAPVHVWTEVHVKAHYTICVLSHFINRILTFRLHEGPGDLTKDVIFHEKLYEKLSECKIDHIEIENVGLSTYNLTRPTDEERELLQRIHLEHLLAHDVVKKARAQLS